MIGIGRANELPTLPTGGPAARPSQPRAIHLAPGYIGRPAVDGVLASGKEGGGRNTTHRNLFMAMRILRRPATIPFLAALILAQAACAPPDPRAENGSPLPEEEVRRLADEARNRLQASEGGLLVLRAIEAHGGLDAWYRAPTSSYTWEYANLGADLRFKSFLVADNGTREVYHDLLLTGSYERPDEVVAQFAWDGTNAWIYPASVPRPDPRFWGISGYYFQQIPFVLADPGVNHRRLPDEELDGVTYHLVRSWFESGVGESPGDSYTLYVHPETGLVEAIRYTVSYGRDVGPDADLPETLFYYDDHVTVDGLTVATAFRGYGFTREAGRGEFRNEAFADSISFRRGFDRSRLEAPEGARFVPAPGG